MQRYIYLSVGYILVDVGIGGGHLQFLIEVRDVYSAIADVGHYLFDFLVSLWLLEPRLKLAEKRNLHNP